MKRQLLIAGLCAGACAAGVICGQLVTGSIVCRDTIGVLFGRGHLLALGQGRGIYEADVQRKLGEMRDAAGDRDGHSSGKITERSGLVLRLVAEEILHSLAVPENISTAVLGQQIGVCESQLGNNKAWRTALRASGLSVRLFSRMVADHLRARGWIERQLMPQLGVSVDEARRHYDEHLEAYFQPERFRANHLFLAAPAEVPADVSEEKSEAISSLSTRISHGEPVSELATLTSEDEATKTRGGDLGFFSEYRMPSDFGAVVAKMNVGEISPPIRTPLGFHIIELTDLKPARQMTFDEAQLEVALTLENEKRQKALQKLVLALASRADFLRSPP